MGRNLERWFELEHQTEQLRNAYWNIVRANEHLTFTDLVSDPELWHQYKQGVDLCATIQEQLLAIESEKVALRSTLVASGLWTE